MLRMLVTPGDALDRLSILHLKLDRGKPQWRQTLEADIGTLEADIARAHDWGALQSDLRRLLDANGLLWDLEDRMHAHYLSDVEAGATGRAIAVANSQRAAVKRDIDTRLGARPELKSYASL